MLTSIKDFCKINKIHKPSFLYSLRNICLCLLCASPILRKISGLRQQRFSKVCSTEAKNNFQRNTNSLPPPPFFLHQDALTGCKPWLQNLLFEIGQVKLSYSIFLNFFLFKKFIKVVVGNCCAKIDLGSI